MILTNALTLILHYLNDRHRHNIVFGSSIICNISHSKRLCNTERRRWRRWCWRAGTTLLSATRTRYDIHFRWESSVRFEIPTYTKRIVTIYAVDGCCSTRIRCVQLYSGGVVIIGSRNCSVECIDRGKRFPIFFKYGIRYIHTKLT